MSVTSRLGAVLCGILATLSISSSAHSQVDSPRMPRRLSVMLPGPEGVTLSPAKGGVQVSWQTVVGAVTYLVLRGPDAATAGTQIGEVPGDQLTFLDQGFSTAAAYQVVAVARDGRRGAGAPVSYAPPMKMLAMPVSPTILRKEVGTLANRNLAVSTPPSITSIGQVLQGGFYAYNGDTVVVQGSGLNNLTGVFLRNAYNPASSGWRVNPGDTVTRQFTPFGMSPSSFSFVPQVPVSGAYTSPYFVIVTRGGEVDTSDAPVQIGAARVVRKITGVKQNPIRAGARLEVYGINLGEVIGGYFGPGVPGSTTNPLLSVMNRTTTSVQLVTTADCRQEGILMLTFPRPGGGSDVLVTGDTVIRAGCAKDTPKGSIVGSEGAANGMMYVPAGSNVSIKGTDLRWVTRVVDQTNTAYPFTYASGAFGERLSLTLPPTRKGGVQFLLENSLIEPVVAGTVTGSLQIMEAPTWYRVDPVWAESGQVVYVAGHNLKYNAQPQVTVGGVPAQVIQADQLTMKVRLGAGTTGGPIEIQNEGGKVQLTGSFTASDGSTHPGFFIVSGPSTVTEVVQPRPTLAHGDTLIVKGQNLARLNGLCVNSSGQGGAPAGELKLRRAPIGRGLGLEISNTEMRVLMDWQPSSVAPGPVKLYAPTTAPGDYPGGNFACTANPGGIQWP